MDDSISRQAILKWIDDCLNHSDKLWEYEEKALIAVKQYVKHLPFAQPEIVRCKECKHYKAYEYTGNLACHYVIGGTVIRNPDDFCSRAERITDE